LELTTLPTSVNGGLTAGVNIWGIPLTLYGTGNSTFGDAPLTVFASDNQWQGPIALNSNIAIAFRGALANQPIATMTANYRDAAGTLTLSGTSPTIDNVTTTTGIFATLSFAGNTTSGSPL